MLVRFRHLQMHGGNLPGFVGFDEVRDCLSVVQLRKRTRQQRKHRDTIDRDVCGHDGGRARHEVAVLHDADDVRGQRKADMEGREAGCQSRWVTCYGMERCFE